MFPTNIYSTSVAAAPAKGLAPTYLPSMPSDPNAATACPSTGSGAGCYKYIAYSVSSSNCTASNPPVTYHLGASLEDLTNSGLSQDVDADTGGAYVYTSYTACTFGLSLATFNGNALNCTGTTANVPDACYDVAP